MHKQHKTLIFQYQMVELNKTQTAVELINKVVKNMPCCDFEVVEYNRNNLLIGGGYSLSYAHSLLIEFEDVFFMTLNSSWSINTDNDFILLAHPNECLKINQRYQIEQGYTLFKIVPENLDIASSFYISAKNVVLKKTHYK